MNAKDRFDNLGYKLRFTNDCLLYETDYGDIIQFNLNEKSYMQYFYNKEGDNISYLIDLNLHIAINHQLLELGWI